jgi:hypothetical protein
MTIRTRRGDAATGSGRFAKAEQFFDAAEAIRELADEEADIGDAYVTLCVHAGIAASDAICCSDLGEHAMGDNHDQAVTLIARVRPDGKALASSLRALLAMKTLAGYSHQPVNAQNRKRAQRHAERLVTAARDRRAGER